MKFQQAGCQLLMFFVGVDILAHDVMFISFNMACSSWDSS
ncbi:hypothetical protein FOQG_05602 [Fusarium oxysporum f. sp. raphani 54005]|uniref:Uncharacterized protein n=6 Tax=Fusarium oxysporum TaxID=5507 RepID=X0CE43_FUSOX|nr:hypothetical protein FOXG_19797 [Fusarium oxysporum f. sp. lycopersici 4287]EXA48026.1 hypothetical protein FOVG_04916 [Fusarium oxysporum f. sp. pisi HDV247]EXK31866.1 hypothetical protein FOMG_12269 [Fusarium oxysporum f. sp. melonis 26406]EXK92471.1 hypothetical protein FOQG_05602 [Fusarium oxysporum f. sp. raphani 54005]EXL87194.1 hypothetical protein FOPG_01507 [Fusarium oxysporum f. sp. conglutinans race 2 54008]EXM25512.1 hypothetical protein FOTG_07903 [Fusarium oxysporum f. sp. vas